jgi:hypothetical protein
MAESGALNWRVVSGRPTVAAMSEPAEPTACRPTVPPAAIGTWL